MPFRTGLRARPWGSDGRLAAQGAPPPGLGRRLRLPKGPASPPSAPGLPARGRDVVRSAARERCRFPRGGATVDLGAQRESPECWAFRKDHGRSFTLTDRNPREAGRVSEPRWLSPFQRRLKEETLRRLGVACGVHRIGRTQKTPKARGLRDPQTQPRTHWPPSTCSDLCRREPRRPEVRAGSVLGPPRSVSTLLRSALGPRAPPVW